jgi:hypothetical protein
MEDEVLSLVPVKLALIIISDDFKDIRKSLTPTNEFYYSGKNNNVCIESSWDKSVEPCFPCISIRLFVSSIQNLSIKNDPKRSSSSSYKMVK